MFNCCFAYWQNTTVEEISGITGGLRLLQALAAAEAANAEHMHGPEAKVDLDVLWIFIEKVRQKWRLLPHQCLKFLHPHRHATDLRRAASSITRDAFKRLPKVCCGTT